MSIESLGVQSRRSSGAQYGFTLLAKNLRVLNILLLHAFLFRNMPPPVRTKARAKIYSASVNIAFFLGINQV